MRLKINELSALCRQMEEISLGMYAIKTQSNASHIEMNIKSVDTTKKQGVLLITEKIYLH